MDPPSTRGWPAVEAAAADSRSGATEIARAAAGALADLDAAEIPRAVSVLLRAHPSMAPLWRLATAALGTRHHRDAIRAFVAMLGDERRAAEAVAGALPDRILTISWSSLVAEAVRRRRPRALLCMESTPGGEGARTAESLRDAAVTVTVVPDEAALTDVPADGVLVGADAVVPGAVVNKVKTRALVEAAGARGVPCWAVAGGAKFLADVIPTTGAFEPVPVELFTGIASPEGLLSPSQARARASRWPVHERLRPLLAELLVGSDDTGPARR